MQVVEEESRKYGQSQNKVYVNVINKEKKKESKNICLPGLGRDGKMRDAEDFACVGKEEREGGGEVAYKIFCIVSE